MEAPGAALAWAEKAGPTGSLQPSLGAERHLLRRAQRLRVAAAPPRSAFVAPELLLLYAVAAGRALGAAQRAPARRGAPPERKKKLPALRSSTRRALKWLTTPESVATMQARRSAGENGIWWWTPSA